jgi:hypothetical protein
MVNGILTGAYSLAIPLLRSAANRENTAANGSEPEFRT